MSFICYKMTHDSGFAPNPYFGVLTLATCKPVIRRTKNPGDWVAGFASKELINNSKKEDIKIPYQGLIYLMKISKAITLDAYFNDSHFAQKKPIKNHRDLIKRSGDNIYHLVKGKYRQLPNNSHKDDPNNIDHDVNGKNVLIADMNESYYFGRNCIFPEKGWKSIGFNFVAGRPDFRADEDLQKILDFIWGNRFAPGIHGKPCLQIGREDVSTHGCGCSNNK